MIHALTTFLVGCVLIYIPVLFAIDCEYWGRERQNEPPTPRTRPFRKSILPSIGATMLGSIILTGMVLIGETSLHPALQLLLYIAFFILVIILLLVAIYILAKAKIIK